MIENVNSGALNLSMTPVGAGAFGTNTYRGLFSDVFNAENIERENFMRNEQAANNQLQRDLYLQSKQNEFTERMSNTSYQRAVEDMKKAGLNPVLALGSGGASTPSAGSGSSSGGYRGGGSGTNSMQLIGTLLNVVAGLYTAGATNAAKIAAANIYAQSRK